MNNYTLEAALTAGAKELKNQKAAKAKRIVMGTDAHLRGYQAARKIDNGAIGAVANFRSQAALLLYVEKQMEQAEEHVSVSRSLNEEFSASQTRIFYNFLASLGVFIRRKHPCLLETFSRFCW
jgi:hypothetical protein